MVTRCKWGYDSHGGWDCLTRNSLSHSTNINWPPRAEWTEGQSQTAKSPPGAAVGDTGQEVKWGQPVPWEEDATLVVPREGIQILRPAQPPLGTCRSSMWEKHPLQWLMGSWSPAPGTAGDVPAHVNY